jgi:gliding motility-associated-like protein
MKIRLLIITALLLIFSATSTLGQAPTITNISPIEGPVGSLVTITGTNLEDLTALSIAGVTGLEISNDGSTVIGFVMPGATTGTVDVTTSFFGSTTVSSSQIFTVITPDATPALQLGADIDGQAASDESGYSVSLSADGQRVAIGAPGHDGTGADAGQVRIYEWSGTAWGQVGLDIDGEAAGDQSGWSVSISANGQRVAIGALGNNGFTGHVRVYEDIAGVWTKIGDDIDGEAAGDQSGYSVSLSADGQRVAIGARLNDANGVNAGHVRIYQDISGVWTQIGVDIDGENANDQSAFSVSLSANGQRVAIGAPFNAGNGSRSGQVRIFEDIAGTWTQMGVDIDGEAINEEYGWSVSLSADGQRVAIGATAVLTGSAGYTRIYEWSGSAWNKIADIDGEVADDRSGISVSLSADGQRVAIGARLNAGGGLDAGHVRIYEDIAGTWSQILADIDGEAAGNESGRSVSLSADGERLAIGAPFNSGNGVSSGHVRAFQLVNPLNLTTSTPSRTAINISTNANISLDFNFPVDGTTANAANINISGQLTGNIAGTFSGGGSNIITFDPTNDFKAGEIITVTITNGLQGTGGEIAAAESFQFATESAIATGFISETIISATQTGNALVDLDGDGDVDVISASDVPALFWLQNDGSGNLADSQISPDNVGLVTAQDVDGDGDMDVIASYSDSDDVSWFENDGNENFTKRVIQPPIGQQTDESLFALDFDLDGDIDILTSKFENPDIVWYENDGSENFTRNVIISFAENGQNKVYPIDMDGDGDIDFLNNYEFTNEISWYENDGFQIFTQNVISTNGDGGTLFAQDIDGDSDVDVFTTTSNGIVWFENDGSQSFTENTIDTTPSAYLTGADIDGDGDVDLVSASANGASSTIDVYNNNGSQVFTKTTLATGDEGLEVKVADMDNDGDLDVIGSFSFGSVILFENGTPPPKITLIAPVSGKVGTEVTISGTGFNSTPTNNIVFFGITRANVTAGTTTELTVTVPTGAIYAPISVLDITNGLSASSLEIFTPAFTPFKNSIEATDFDPKENFATDGQANTFVINDFDGDGKNDIIIRVFLPFPSPPETSIFRNTSIPGTVSFASKIDLAADFTSSISVGDLDGDGLADLIFTDFQNDEVAILRNTSSVGTISFAPKIVFPVGPDPFGSAVGDLDGDGKPELAVVDNADAVVSVLVNVSTPGSINFETKVDFATDSNPRHIIISDLDGDGIVDVATGNFSNTISILRNTSTIGNISFDTKIDLPSTEFGNIRTIAVGDFDGDGKRDLATANASDPNLSIYRNNSSPGIINFEPHIDLITGSSPSSVIISDFNGDGMADLAAVNTSSSSASISIFKNNSSVGSIDFANQVELPIESGSISNSIDAADIDGDGRTDFISSRSFPAPFSFSVFRNNPVIPPLSLDTSLPSANATSADRNASIELDFDADVDLLSVNSNSTNANEVYDDNITITGNLSGQIEGTFSLGADNSIIIFTPSTDFKAGEKISVTISSSVLGSGGENAIPTSLSFIVASGTFEGAFIETTSGILGMADGSFDWGDYDNDGDLDVIVVGYDPDFNTQATIYRNENGAFTDIGAGITGVFFSAAEWGDYDNDGDLDLVVAGLNATGTARLTTIYRNNGDNTFTDIGAGLQGVDFPALDWGDFDNDGDLDLIVTGRFSFGPTLVSSIVYQNNAGIFTDISAGLQGLYNGSADWGDYDGDGDLDLLLTGFDELSGRYALIYNNDNGTFSDHGAGLPGIGYGDAEWGDYDNDGDLDILLLGDGSSITFTSIFNNDGGVFTDIGAGLPTTSEGSAKWGDFDGDGFLDLLITGTDFSTSTEITNIYKNNGGTSFSDIDARLQTVYFAGLAEFIDYDGDGDLDLFAAGESSSTPSGTSAVLYENTTFPIFYSQNSGVFDTPVIWNSAPDGSGFNPIASNFTDGKTDFIIQNGDVITAAPAPINMNNFIIEDGGIYQNGSQDVVVFGSTNISGEFSDAITAGESTFFGPLIIESTGSFTTSGITNNTFRFYGDITNRGIFNLTSSVFWNLESDLTILNESTSAINFSDLNSGIGSINANVTIADSPGGGNVLLRSNDYIRMADNTTIRNELGDYPINSRILEMAELRALSGSANFENASNAIVLLRDDNLGTFDAINVDFTAMDNLVRYFSNGNVLAVDHYHITLTAGATSALLGSINVFGDLTINNGNVLDASGHNITIAGNWINSTGLAGFLPASGIVSFNGSNMDPQIISGETNFNNVVINNTGSSRKVTAGNSISIASSLTLTSGVLEVTDGNLLSLSASATASGAFGISEMIQLAPAATVRKYFDSDGSFTFPIGTANIYNETNLTLTTGTNYNGPAGSRYVELNLIGAEEPNVLLPGFALTKYWTVNSVNLDNISGSLALTYDGLDATNGDENNYLAASYDGNWNTNSNVDAATNTISFDFSAALNLNASYTAGEAAAFLPIPLINAFTPASAPEGAIVTIEGTNFSTATAVSFGGTPASSFTIVSNTEIEAEIGSGSSGNISVTNLAGTASTPGFTFIPVPTISTFTPASAAQGEIVTITGTGFTFASAVSFGGTAAATFTVVSDTEIAAEIGSGTSGTITVTTPGGIITVPGFAFIPAPTISAFTPTSAAQGDAVTIEGTNFTDASAVSFGGTAATSITVISSTEISATVGFGSSGDISITTAGGTVTSAGFEFIAAPTVSSFSPLSASPGDTVTIIGTNFTDAILVTFGGTTATFMTVSDTEIIAIVGDGSSGEVAVTTPGGTFSLGGFILLKPELAVFDPSGDTINNNQNVAINIGAALQGSSLIRQFTVENSGTSNLSISTITSSNEAFQVLNVPDLILPGTSEAFSLEFSATDLGSYSSEISINNTSDIPEFTFTVNAELTRLNIIDNDTDSIIISNQAINLGSTFIRIDIDKLFNIENVSANSTIEILSIRVDNPVFQIIDAPTSIPQSSSAQFTVRLIANEIGEYTGIVTVITNLNEFSFQVAGIVLPEASTEIRVFNVITPNGDGRHDFLFIENITEYTNNSVTIFNRLGNKVFEVSSYNNDDRIFEGISDNGNELLTGNYYYVIDKGNGDKRLSGFLIIKR